MMSYTVFRMLRRSIVAIIAGAAVIAVCGCGVKGPLRLPPGQSAPAPTGLPPGAIPSTTSPESDRPAYTPPPPAPVNPTPDENKDPTG
jgi:predicted small lipoprotein YifL